MKSRSPRSAKASIKDAIGPSGLVPIVLPVFVAAVLLLGGSGRADTSSLILLRPLAAIALAYGLVRLAQAPERSGLRVPLLALGALALLAAVQLIPLPPGIWTALPGREPIVAALATAGIEPGWQPISVVPMATLNSLGALVVPLAVLALFASANEEGRRRALLVLAGFMAVSVALAMLQTVSPGSGLLYLYRVTNDGFPVGLFANRNHHAVMLAAMIPFVLALGERWAKERGAGPLWVSRFAALVMVAIAVMTGSRAGSVLVIAAFAISAPMFADARIAASGRFGELRRARIAIAGLAVLFAGGLAALFAAGGGAAFERLADKESFDDLRFQILPEVFAMIRDSLPLGWGFGTFPEVYEIYERREMIRPTYINHAHNDWIEIVTEGGLVAPLIVIGLAIWVIAKAWQNLPQLLRPRADAGRIRFAAFIALGVLVAGSAFDYPLRTPAGAAAFVLFLGLLTAPLRDNARAKSRAR